MDSHRIDTSELKHLLKQHKPTFKDEEIDELGELFYAGQGGDSIPIEMFIHSLDEILVDGAEKKESPLNTGTHGDEYLLFHRSFKSYSEKHLKGIANTHVEPQSFRDKLAFYCVKGVRAVFDAATGWNAGPMTPDKVLNRTIYLETIAAVPGMVAAILRHFRSLRTMKPDGGMLQMFLEEANNERMHLLTFVRMKNPGILFRAAVIGGQFGFGTLFGEFGYCHCLASFSHIRICFLHVGLSYIISPQFCHRFVGYVEEEAVHTYTKIIQSIEEASVDSDLGKWKTASAPRIARSYWKLGPQGTVLDLMYAVRADEAEHRDVNHLCTEYKQGDLNPVFNTSQQLNTMMIKYMKDVMERDIDAPIRST